MDRVLGEHKPITADVFITNYCNNKCPYCTYARWDLDGKVKNMTFSEFVKYAERMVELGVEGIILTGGGEPTVNPDFENIAKWLEHNKIHYGINTNFNKLVYIKPDYLKVSLDAWNEESYKAARGVSAYEKVRDNIIKYDAWRRTHSPNTTLGIQIVVKDETDIRKFYEANKDLPVDYIAFRPMESTQGEYYKNKNDIYQSTVLLIKNEIQKLEKLDSRVSLSFKWDMLKTKTESCTAEWAQIAVNENGEVMYCCHKPYEIVGHIMDKDIMKKKAEAVTNMSMCDIPCRMTAPNVEVERIITPQKDKCFI